MRNAKSASRGGDRQHTWRLRHAYPPTKRFVGSALLGGAAILAVVSLRPSPTRAQSAVETVALMLWGMQGSSKTKRMSETLWATEDQNGDRSTFGIVQLTGCQFRVSREVRRAGMIDTLEFDYVLNFAAVNGYSAWLANGRDRRIIVKVEGQGWYSRTVRSKATGRVVYSIPAGNVDAYVANGGSVERLQSAYAHFRSAFCRGRG
jgi:hypothetical protein